MMRSFLIVQIVFFIVANIACSHKGIYSTASLNSSQACWVLNPDLNMLHVYNGDFEVDSIKNRKNFPIKIKNRRVIYSSQSKTTPFFRQITFVSKQKPKNFITKAEVLNGNFKPDSVMIVQDTICDKWGGLYTAFYLPLSDSTSCYLPTKQGCKEEVAKEVKDFYKLQQQACFDVSTARFVPENTEQMLFFAKQFGKMKVPCCTGLDSIITQSQNKSYNRLFSLHQPEEWRFEDIAAVVSLVSNYDIVIVQETHSASTGVDFARQLVQMNEFDEIMCEAISPNDTLLNVRKIVLRETGYYTQSPEYSKFLNEQLSAGVRIVSYDYVHHNSSMSRNWAQFRDSMQAVNLMQNKKGRPLVLAGGRHGELNCSDNYKTMGCFLATQYHQKVLYIKFDLRRRTFSANDSSGVLLEASMRKQKIEGKALTIRTQKKTGIYSLYKKSSFKNYGINAIPDYRFWIDSNVRNFPVFVEPKEYQVVRYSMGQYQKLNSLK